MIRSRSAITALAAALTLTVLGCTPAPPRDGQSCGDKGQRCYMCPENADRGEYPDYLPGCPKPPSREDVCPTCPTEPPVYTVYTVSPGPHEFVLSLPFDTGDAALGAAHEQALMKFFAGVDHCDRVEVRGYADATGPFAFNNVLAGKRARAVEHWLETSGLRGKIAGREVHNLAPTSGQIGDAKDQSVNRRVDVLARCTLSSTAQPEGDAEGGGHEPIPPASGSPDPTAQDHTGQESAPQAPAAPKPADDEAVSPDSASEDTASEETAVGKGSTPQKPAPGGAQADPEPQAEPGEQQMDTSRPNDPAPPAPTPTDGN